MSEPANKPRMYKILAAVFAFAGLVWIVGGLASGRYFVYPFFGLMNWAVAYFCYVMAQNA